MKNALDFEKALWRGPKSMSILILNTVYITNRTDRGNSYYVLAHGLGIVISKIKQVVPILNSNSVASNKIPINNSDLGKERRRFFPLKMAKFLCISEALQSVQKPASNMFLMTRFAVLLTGHPRLK